MIRKFTIAATVGAFLASSATALATEVKKDGDLDDERAAIAETFQEWADAFEKKTGAGEKTSEAADAAWESVKDAWDDVGDASAETWDNTKEGFNSAVERLKAEMSD